MRVNHRVGLVLFWMAFTLFQNVSAQEQIELIDTKQYQVQPGDILEITVWKEEGLQQEVLVRPDGGLSFPLVGDFKKSMMKNIICIR